MQTCPYCQSMVRQVKNGHNPAGSQRYRCRACGRKYTPEPTPQGYDAPTRQQALRLYAEGLLHTLNNYALWSAAVRGSSSLILG